MMLPAVNISDLIMGHLFGDPVQPAGPFGAIGVSMAVVWMWVAAALVIAVNLYAFRRQGLLPVGPLRNAFEAICEYLWVEIAKPILGEGGKRYMPILWSYFFFILFCNLIGLVPGTLTPTGNINVTATLAVSAFCVFNGAGMYEQGILHYWLGLVPHGVPKAIWPFMLVVEIIGLFAKTFALAVRLFANMVGGHATVLAIFGLIFMAGEGSAAMGYAIAPLSVLGTVGIYMLETMVAFIQAFIFTFLLTVFIGMAVHPH